MNKYAVAFLLYLVASTQAINCPEGADFSNGNNACSHRLHKREAEEIHSIDIRRVKEKLTEAYQEIRPLLENVAAEIAPSIHEKFSLTYLPAIRSFRDEVMPFVYAKVYPQVQKYYKIGLNLGEKFVGKAYRSYKLSNSTHLAIVSISDLIDEAYNEAKPLLQMGRYLSARMMMSKGNYRGKREVHQLSENFLSGNLEEVHVIDIQKLTDKLIEAYHSIKPILEEFVAEIAPSVYEKFSQLYLPKIRELKNEISPFFHAKVYPQVQKYMRFASNVAEKLADKAYRSYQLSNSTHINIVSISDIIEEVYAEMKPILDLGKYLSTKMMNTKHYRGKRDLSGVSKTSLFR